MLPVPIAAYSQHVWGTCWTLEVMHLAHVLLFIFAECKFKETALKSITTDTACLYIKRCFISILKRKADNQLFGIQ